MIIQLLQNTKNTFEVYQNAEEETSLPTHTYIYTRISHSFHYCLHVEKSLFFTFLTIFPFLYLYTLPFFFFFSRILCLSTYSHPIRSLKLISPTPIPSFSFVFSSSLDSLSFQQIHEKKHSLSHNNIK
ncbi:hypothetical protein Pst134EB_008139 [Puccinia striiformis f. sp. tritici]|nr:hypothetical protein Pst134EB_008139 [Puccinia striiformis f. sp. tritici]